MTGHACSDTSFMTPLRYDLASVAVFDPVAMNRTGTRNVLFSLGFREIETYATVDDLKSACVERDFDVIILETSKADGPVYDYVTRLRRGEIGRNPFAIVLVTTWLPEGQLVKKVLDCGADDLLCRPFATNVVGERIRTHAVARKGFVVTSEYIGPDRRKDPDRAGGATPIEVANSLKLKAVDQLSGAAATAALAEAVYEGRRTINLERMRRAAFQIGIIAGFVHSQTHAMAEGGVRRSDLDKILTTAQELSEMAEAENALQASKTAITVVNVTKRALNGDEIAKNAQILVRLSVALQVILSPNLDEDHCKSELEETLERIQARGRRA
jgi:DNA-binding NarL/FixJ family response regulator